MTGRLDRGVLFGVVLWIVTGMFARCATPARAQTDAEVRVVAVTVAHESTSIADARGIWSVLRGIADRHRWSLRTAARSYSPRLWAGTSRRPWALDLDERCLRRVGPIGPATCARLFARVREVMAGERCPVDVWGMRSDYDRAQERGRRFVFIVCAESERNLFAAEVTP